MVKLMNREIIEKYMIRYTYAYNISVSEIGFLSLQDGPPSLLVPEESTHGLLGGVLILLLSGFLLGLSLISGCLTLAYLWSKSILVTDKTFTCITLFLSDAIHINTFF